MLTTTKNMLSICVKLTGKDLAEAVTSWLKINGHVPDSANVAGLTLHEDVDADSDYEADISDSNDSTGLVIEFVK
jgi:hypothetical protein